MVGEIGYGGSAKPRDEGDIREFQQRLMAQQSQYLADKKVHTALEILRLQEKLPNTTLPVDTINLAVRTVHSYLES